MGSEPSYKSSMKMYTKILSLHNFLIKSRTLNHLFFGSFIGEQESSKKGVGDENLIVSLKQNGGDVDAHTAQ